MRPGCIVIYEQIKDTRVAPLVLVIVTFAGSASDPTFRTERNAQSAPNFCKTGPKKPPKCEKWVPNWHQFWGHLGPPGLRRNLSCAGYYSSMAPKWRRGCWPSWLEARPASAPHLGSRVRIPADPRVPRATYGKKRGPEKLRRSPDLGMRGAPTHPP